MPEIDVWDPRTIEEAILTGEVNDPMGFPKWDDLTDLDVSFNNYSVKIRLPAKVCMALVNDHREVRFSGYLWRYDNERKVFQVRIDPDRLTPWLKPPSDDVLTIK